MDYFCAFSIAQYKHDTKTYTAANPEKNTKLLTPRLAATIAQIDVELTTIPSLYNHISSYSVVVCY
jgi:hypothetical protein